MAAAVGATGSCSSVLALDRRAQQVIQRGPRDRFVARGLYSPLACFCETDAGREYVGVVQRTSIAPERGAGQIFLSSGDGRIGGPCRCAFDQDAPVRFRDPDSHVRCRRIGREAGNVALQGGGFRRGASPPAVEEELLDRERAVKESQRIGIVQRIDREVGRRELPRGKQGAEDEDRLVAPLPGFRH